MAHRTRPALLVIPIAALLLVGCQAGGASPSAGPLGSAESVAPSVAASVAASPSAAESMAAGGASVVVATSTSLGDYLTDADGNTLYVFLNDSPGETSCFESCLQTWPPLTLDAGATPTAGDGISGELGTIQRSDDGSSQVTLDGWPLYFFAGDSAPGDTNGEGVGNVWFVARPDGSVPAATSSRSAYHY